MAVKTVSKSQSQAAPIAAVAEKPAAPAATLPYQQELPVEFAIEREPIAAEEQVAVEASRFEYFSITVHDELFPQALKGEHMPHAIFYHGNPTLLGTPMIAAVTRGKSTMLESCRKLGAMVASKGKSLLVGGCRDEDMYFIAGALESGANVIVALHHGLEEEKIPAELEAWVQQGRVLFVSFSLPNARYTEQQAKERNAVMVALSDYTVAAQVSAKAGSWNLCEQTRAAGKRLFIMNTKDEGNQALIGKPGVTVITYKQ